MIPGSGSNYEENSGSFFTGISGSDSGSKSKSNIFTKSKEKFLKSFRRVKQWDCSPVFTNLLSI